jgi:hypothetical protein
MQAGDVNLMWTTALVAGGICIVVLLLWWLSARFEKAILKDLERDRYG